ncbi:MAG: tetratricopeptide repeat protein [Rickettsiales bacterium]
MSDDLIREFEEDMRAQRSQDFMQRFGKSMVWASVAIVAGTAGGVLWKNYQHSNATQNTNLLISATHQVFDSNNEAAITTLSKMDNVDGPHYGLAMLRKAEAQRAAGDQEAAEKTLAELSRHTGDAQLFADLAKLQLASADMKVEKDSPIAAALTEQKAWTLLAEGKKDEAASLFGELYHNKQTPASMQERVTLALQYMAPEKLEITSKDHE